MAIERVTSKNPETAEERERIKKLREKYQRAKPSPDEVEASDDYDGPVQLALYWELRQTMAALRAERERQGLSLADLAERSGIDKGAISKLETGKQVNPTIDTITRLASALGLRLGLTLVREHEEAATSGSGAVQAPSDTAEVVSDSPFVHGIIVHAADAARRHVLDQDATVRLRYTLPTVEYTGDKGIRFQIEGTVVDPTVCLDWLHRAINASRDRIAEELTHVEAVETVYRDALTRLVGRGEVCPTSGRDAARKAGKPKQTSK